MESSMGLTSDEKSVASALVGLNSKRPIDAIASGPSPSRSQHQQAHATIGTHNNITNNDTMEPHAKHPKTNHSLTSAFTTTSFYQPGTTTSTGYQPSLHTNANSYTPILPAPPGMIPAYSTLTNAFAFNSAMMGSITGTGLTSNTDADDENTPRELKPAPYFYYHDHSTECDPDPLTPLTPLARVPNFPAKMHAILSRPDLADVVTWMPHGRSWRVLKPREFEIRVIPTYFEHSKFSSFIRQANGWGFRRITHGKDRNSYYHELFLRGLPHLCKRMKRPGVSKKATVDAEHEPEFYKISEEHPVALKAENDYNILLPSTVLGGPRARMPVWVGRGANLNANTNLNTNTATAVSHLPSSHNSSGGAAFWHNNIGNGNPSMNFSNPVAVNQAGTAPMDAKMPHNPNTHTNIQQSPPNNAANASPCAELGATQVSNMSSFATVPVVQTQGPLLSQQQQRPQPQAYPPMLTNQQAAAFQHAMTVAAAAIGSDPTSQFAAGFAAAAALTNPHFQRAFNQAIADSHAHAAAAAMQSASLNGNGNGNANHSNSHTNVQHGPAGSSTALLGLQVRSKNDNC